MNHGSMQLAVSAVTWETPIVCYATKSNVIISCINSIPA